MSIAKLTGRITHPLSAQLPAVTLVVELRDTSLQDTEAKLIASTARLVPAAGSLAYTVEYDSDVIEAGRQYTLGARLYCGDRLHMINDTQHGVDPGQTTEADIAVIAAHDGECAEVMYSAERIGGAGRLIRPADNA